MENQNYKKIEDKVHEKCEKSMKAFERALGSIRSARASTDMLDGIQAKNYGTLVPLKQMATITTPEPRLLLVTPFNPQKEMLMEIEKSIYASNLGLQPQIDGQVIRVFLPELNMERRKELVKQLDGKMEEFKISLRNIRRDANQEIRKSKEIPEDQLHEMQNLIQKLIDIQVKKADALREIKSQSILAV